MDRKKNKNPRNRTKAVSEKDGGTQRFVQAAFRKPIKLDRLQFRIHKNRQPWDLAKLSPREFYLYCITGVYPLTIPKPKGKQQDR